MDLKYSVIFAKFWETPDEGLNSAKIPLERQSPAFWAPETGAAMRI